jgi:hypothetical protein
MDANPDLSPTDDADDGTDTWPDPEPLAIDGQELSDFVDRYERFRPDDGDDGPDIRSDVPVPG